MAPWQERRAKDILAAHLDAQVRVEQVASECGLSASHFSRAFRETTGLTPHRWLVKRRVDAARDLIRNLQLSLSDVAIACGFADQSHFTRVFTREVGLSPGAWRRALS